MPTFARYLRLSALMAVVVLGAAWAYMTLSPMYFMESGYASWRAKLSLLRECRAGTLAFLGDSRVDAAVIPAALPVEASNIGLVAGTAVETRAAVDQLVTCPTPPKQVVVSLVPDHFDALTQFYWLLSIRYGFLSARDVLAVENLTSALGDTRSLATPTPDGLSGRMRDWMYVVRFPSLSFGSMMRAHVFGRYQGNMAHYNEVLQARGWTSYAGGAGVQVINPEAFNPTRLQVAEFDALLGTLHDHGIQPLILFAPFAPTHPETAQLLTDYRRYMADVARRMPDVHFVNEDIPIWPARLFADGSHLNEDGAKVFSARLAVCVHEGVLQPGCDLDWHEDSAGSPGSSVAAIPQDRR